MLLRTTFLVLKSLPGILHLIDEVSRLPKTTDVELTKRLHEVHSSNAFFPRPDRKQAGTTFVVKHYAGEVAYTVEGFLGKNNDTLSNDLTLLCQSSTQSLLAGVVKAHEAKKEAAAAARDAKADAKLAKPSATPASGAFSAAKLSVTPAAASRAFAARMPLSESHGPNSPRSSTTPRGGGASVAKEGQTPGSLVRSNTTPLVPKLAFDVSDAAAESATKGGSVTDRFLGGGGTPRSASVTNRFLGEGGGGGGPMSTPRRGSATPRGGQRSFSSVGLTFAKQMASMVGELDVTRCNFVRCIKPNHDLQVHVVPLANLLLPFFLLALLLTFSPPAC